MAHRQTQTIIRRPKPKPLVGLDISDSSVKLVELRKAGASYRVTHFGAGAIPPNAISDKSIVDIEGVGEAVRLVWKRSGTHLKSAAIAIGDVATITKIVTIPAGLSARECEEQVGLAAANLIPFPMEEVVWDFELLGIDTEHPEMQEALLVATRRDNVEHRQAVLEFAGLKAEIVDCESFALEHAFSLFDGTEGKAVALLDVGATTTTLSIFRDGHIVYTRDQLFGGNQLTNEIMRYYEVSYEEAGRAKRHGGLPDDYEQKVLSPFLESLVQEAGRALQFYRAAASEDTSIDRVLFCGGCAALPGAAEAVGRHLDLPVELANPLAALSSSARARAGGLEREPYSLMVACGLALRSFQ